MFFSLMKRLPFDYDYLPLLYLPSVDFIQNDRVLTSQFLYLSKLNMVKIESPTL